jgi:prepilin-type processing-associated H-X9-DG protein
MENYPIDVPRPAPILPQIIVVAVIVLIIAVILVPVFASARAAAREHTCISNLKLQSESLLLYSKDWDETLPSASTWMDRTAPDLIKARHQFSESTRDGDPLQCPTATANYSGPIERVYGYAYNNRLSKLKLDKVELPAEAVMVFDSSSLFRNAADAFMSVQIPVRHSNRDNIAFLDGHVRSAQLFQFLEFRKSMEKNEPWFKADKKP